MTTYIKRYLFEDAKLRDRALLELTRGLRDGRLIALTGAMTTEALGYFSWRDLCTAFADIATDLVDQIRERLGGWATADAQAKLLLNVIERHCSELRLQADEHRRIDNRVHFSVVREAFEAIDSVLLVHGRKSDRQGQLYDPPRKIFDDAFAKRFQGRNRDGKSSPIKPLLEDLGITRFVTLNYDFELERALMLRRDERDTLRFGRYPDADRAFLDFVGSADSQRPIVVDSLDRLSRTIGDGLSVESDILNRERVDRLIEFAVGSANIDRHIMHLHGRADRPERLILDIRDYDQLYRRDDLFKNPFEHGLRVLFAGNPVLFIGVGMTEPEINATLQDFVSDSPYSRTAPAFLLWNTTRFSENTAERAEQKRLRRLDYLQRLGVFVLFDEDLVWIDPTALEQFRRTNAQLETDLKKATDAFDKRSLEAGQSANALDALREMVHQLPETIARFERQGNRQGDKWRDTTSRSTVDCDRPVRLWGTPYLADIARGTTFQTVAGEASADPVVIRDGQIPVYFHPNGQGHARPTSETKIEEEIRLDFPIALRPALNDALCVGLTSPGFGRGLLAEYMAQHAPERFGVWTFGPTKPCNRLLVNAGFSYDSDALLSGIADFLWARHAREGLVRPCRELMFATGMAFDVAEPTLIIINGIDRFFGFDGAPLSAELDHLVRCITVHSAGKLQWLVLGTDRLRHYLDALGLGSYFLTSTPLAPRKPSDRDDTPFLGSKYLSFLAKRFEARGLELQPSGLAKLHIAGRTGRDAVRRAFFAAYLAPTVLGKVVDCAVAFEVLRTMSFIGWPVELGALLHAPKIVAILTQRLDQQEPKPRAFEAKLKEVMGHLLDLGLVIEVARFDADSHTQTQVDFTPAPGHHIDLDMRFGLHRALATELRERHGVPLSEAKLSSTFNMSLFAAQPADDYKPEAQFHDELGNLVDRLIGAWKDSFEGIDVLDPKIRAKLAPDVLGSLSSHPGDTPISVKHFAALCSPRAVACLRAALAVIRGYYSTSNLLALDVNDRLVTSSRDGALTEHSDRLDRLLKGFGKIATAREKVREIVKSKDSGVPEAALKSLRDEPFYPDDLVWLHNERGVVKLAQGDLYGARRSFGLALRVNGSLEGEHRGHNWRRIMLNMIGVLIERGRLQSAETRLDEIEASIDQAEWSIFQRHENRNGQGRGRMGQIVETFGQQDGFIDDCASIDFAREEILMAGLVTGYRGLIAQNRGREKTAQGLFERAISILRRLGEQRAYALFQRHYASLRRFTRDPEGSARQIELAVASADAAHQMDMSYRARVLRADQSRRARLSSADRRVALDDITRALKYAALTDSYRVRIEAAGSLARMMLDSGEFDAALKHASDAFAVACRFGHSLHKISLRVQIGEILIQRGDPKSGEALLDQALKLAARIGYQRIVERVQRARRNEPPSFAVIERA